MRNEQLNPQLPTRASIREALRSITGVKEPTREEAVFDQISDRVTAGVDEATAMRIDGYLLDLMLTVKGGADKDPSDLLEEVKNTAGYARLSLGVDVPDGTTISFIEEIRAGLK